MLAGSAPRKNLARLRNPRAEYYAWKMEETNRILDQLRTQSESGVPIIVEGRRDEAALRRLGIAGRVHCLKARGERSEEHTSELQSQSNLVCRLLLEKK